MQHIRNILIIILILPLMILTSLSHASAGAKKNYKQCETAAMYVEEGNKLVQNEPVKAESLYREVLKKCPDSANASYNLAIALYNQHKASDSVEVLKAYSIQTQTVLMS